MPELLQATPDDWSAIAELVAAAYGRWVPVLGRSPKPMTVDYRSAINRHRFDLLTTRSVLVGLIETCIEPDCLLVVNVAVSPDHQKNGYGRLLMQHAEILASNAKCTAMRLFTNQLMTKNIALYESLGFHICRTEDLAEGDTLVHMRKFL